MPEDSKLFDLCADEAQDFTEELLEQLNGVPIFRETDLN